MREPLLSIVIANYNYGRFLSEAIKSVFNQLDFGTWNAQKVPVEDVELIIVDGDSTDNSVQVIKKYANGLPPGIERKDLPNLHLSPTPITYWISEPDHGQSHAFNKGFSHAHGRFLTWLNADDVMTPGALAAVFKEMKAHPRCEWFVGSSVWTDRELRIHRCFCAHRFSCLRAKYGMISASGPSSFFSRRLYDAVGKIDETLHYVMDTDLWRRFYKKEGVIYRRTRHNVWAYRQHEASKMSGADEHTTVRALENRRRAISESKMLAQRYDVRTDWRGKLVFFLTISFFDHIVAFARTATWRGKYATEI